MSVKQKNLSVLSIHSYLEELKVRYCKIFPPKVEKIHYCEMNEEQEELYERVKSQYRNEDSKSPSIKWESTNLD